VGLRRASPKVAEWSGRARAGPRENVTVIMLSSMFALAAPPQGGSLLLQFVPLVLVVAIFYFIILLPMKRKQQKVQEFIAALKVNDKVITTGGIYGQITRVGEQSVQLQIADKIRIEVAKAAIGGLQGQPAVVDPQSE
jgi:preprotein translocase subunit YajC